MPSKRFSTFWGGLAIILVLAAVPRLLSYDFSLPYVDHLDEPNYYLAGLEWRGLYDNNHYYDNVPPGYMLFQAATQPILERVGIIGLAPTTAIMRLVAVFANLATLIVIALTARLAGGNLAGLMAGAAWAVSALVLENGVYALPNPLIYLLVALSLWLAATALRRPEHQHWCIWSVISGLLAILAKYPTVPVLALGGGVALVIFVRDRRRGFRYLLIQAGLVLATAVWLIFIYGIDFNSLQREGAVVRQQGLGNLLSLERTLNNIYYATVPLNTVALGLLCGLGLLAFIVAKRRGSPRINAGVIGLCLVLLVTIPWLAASFSLVSATSRLRDVLPATTAASVILGLTVAQIAYIIPQRWATAGKALLVLLVAGLVFLPQMAASWQLVQKRVPQDRRVTLRQWADTNLEPGTVLVTRENHKTFNPFWGGIPHRYWFDWIETESILEHPVNDWREAYGISYAVLPLSQWQHLQNSEAGRDTLAQMLRLRDFIEPPGQRGPEMVIYRLWRMDEETNVQFGQRIRLMGYDQSARQVAPGETIALRFYWQASARPQANYSLFVHLTPADGSDVLTQVDGAPATLERPTMTWDDPGEMLISTPFELTVPPDLPSGEYRMLVGLYNYLNGQRLPSHADSAAGDSLALTTIVVSG